MRKIFASPQYDEVGMLKSFLEEEGVECEIMNVGANMARGEIPLPDADVELWVVQDSNYEKAKITVDEWLSCKK